MNRHDFLNSAAFTAALNSSKLPTDIGTGETAGMGEEDSQQIYKHLSFATMTGESPLTMWARLRHTDTWLAGPLGPMPLPCDFVASPTYVRSKGYRD